ncbi:MAG: lysostaphin resistance A-like protein [bacterium]
MESVIFKAQPDRKAIPIGKAFILLFFIICIEAGSVFLYLLLMKRVRIVPLFFTAIQRIADLAIILGFIFKWGYCFEHLGLSAKRFKKGIIHGLFWCMGFGSLVALIGAVLYFFGINPLLFLRCSKNRSLTGIITYILVGCFLGPVVEDLLFTGLIYNGLRTRLNIAYSSLIVSILFASVHAIAYGFVSIALIIQFVGGLLFTLSFEFSGSLLTPMIIHWCGNIAILAIQMI